MSEITEENSRQLDFRPTIDMQWEITRTGAETDGEMLEAIASIGPRTAAAPAHVHPAAEDSFEVLEGRIEVLFNRTWVVYEPGDRVAAHAGVPHSVRNPFGTPARVINRHKPALRFEQFFRDLATLTADGRINAFPPRMPRATIYSALLITAYPDEMLLSGAERVSLHTLARVGHMLGMQLPSHRAV
jgi:quercetin dioxygenase-like cupin family protein